MNFWHLNRTERLKRLATHTKFMVSREPFERLLSAWRNKLETYKDDGFGEIAYKIHKIYGGKNEKGEFKNKEKSTKSAENLSNSRMINKTFFTLLI